VDAYWLALQCAQQGIDANGLAQCRVIASDLYADLGDAKYDLILSNPPFHSGHTVDTQAAEALIKGSWEHLTGSGRLRIVANRFLPYDKLIKATFGAGNTRVIVDNGKYWVLEGKK
jgi:16S rRNA (guanine1207-N2)-methyltransferase